MKLKHLAILGLILLRATCATAQDKLPLTNAAILLFQESRLEDARIKIDEATKQGSESSEAAAWYARGFIYKEIFKQTDNGIKNSPNRDIAIDAIMQCINLDKTSELRQPCMEVLTWLAGTFYLHALNEAELMTPESRDEPDRFYTRYRQLIRIIEPDHQPGIRDLDFNKKMGSVLSKIYEKNPEDGQAFIDASTEYYKNALKIDSLDYDSNYNLAIAYFNQGVRKIRRIGIETEIAEIIRIQDQSIKLFWKSLPYMINADIMQPGRKESLKGLYFIHRALNDEEKAAFFKAELERLFGTGK